MEEQKQSAKSLKESTKEMVDKLLNLFGLKKDEGALTEKTPSKELIKGIHKLLVTAEAQRKSDFKDELKSDKEEERNTEKRHREILKALTIRRKPVKRVKKEEKKPKKQTEQKETGKGGEPPKTTEPPKVTTPPAPKPTATPTVTPPAPTVPTTTPVRPPIPPVSSIIPQVVVGGLSTLGISSAIAKGESAKGSYNAANMGTRNNKIVPVSSPLKLEDMTIEEVMRRQSIKWGAPNENEKLFAVGKYQMIPDTLSDAVKSIPGINLKDKFDGPMQERLFNDYLLGVKRPAIAKYLNSPTDDPKLLHSALKQLSLEWASIADPDIPGGKTSHYGSGNKASLSVDQASSLLRNDRENVQKKLKTVVPNAASTGATVDVKSKERKELKSSAEEYNTTNQITNNYRNTENTSSQEKPKVVNDSSPYERVAKG